LTGKLVKAPEGRRHGCAGREGASVGGSARRRLRSTTSHTRCRAGRVDLAPAEAWRAFGVVPVLACGADLDGALGLFATLKAFA
jgi:hypothetical protein